MWGSRPTWVNGQLGTEFEGFRHIRVRDGVSPGTGNQVALSTTQQFWKEID